MRDKHNKIILEPYVEAPLKEKCLFANKVALAKVQQGIKDAKAGYCIDTCCRFLSEHLDVK